MTDGTQSQRRFKHRIIFGRNVFVIWTWIVRDLGLAADMDKSRTLPLRGLNMVADCSWTRTNPVRGLCADCLCLKIGCGHGQIMDIAIARIDHGRSLFVDADESCPWPVCGQFVSVD